MQSRNVPFPAGGGAQLLHEVVQIDQAVEIVTELGEEAILLLNWRVQKLSLHPH